MNKRTFSAALTVSYLLLAVGVGALASAGPFVVTASAATQTEYALPDITAEKWTGDLDGMLGRRRGAGRARRTRDRPARGHDAGGGALQ